MTLQRLRSQDNLSKPTFKTTGGQCSKELQACLTTHYATKSKNKHSARHACSNIPLYVHYDFSTKKMQQCLRNCLQHLRLATFVTLRCQTFVSALQGTLAVAIHPQCGVTHPSRSQGKEPISRKAYRAFIESETKLTFG